METEIDLLVKQPLRFCFDQIEADGQPAIVDMGCGNGVFAVLFALHGMRVFGIDKEGDALARARQLALRFGVQNRCSFTCSYSEQMPFETGIADIVFSRSTLQYMDKKRALGECIRVLKPSGSLVMIENLPYNPFINLYRIVRRCRVRGPGSSAIVRPVRSYLTFREIYDLQTMFSTFRHEEYHLFRVFTIALNSPFGDRTWFRSLDYVVDKLDRTILGRFALSRRFAWLVAVVGKGKTTCDSGLAPTPQPLPHQAH